MVGITSVWLFGTKVLALLVLSNVSLFKNVVSLNHDEIYFIWRVVFENG